MKYKALYQLTTDIGTNYINGMYNKSKSWIDDYFKEKNVPNYSFSFGIEVPDVKFKVGNESTDFANSKKIYDAFMNTISPVQASDPRLWVLLAHTYWDYMKGRWPIDPPSRNSTKDKDMISKIGSRYFFQASMGKAFVRHGIARLYWGAYLTYDKESSEPYKMTQYLFKKQDTFVQATEHAFARNKPLLLGALRVLSDYENNFGTLSREKIRSFFIRLNEAGGLTVFDWFTTTTPEDATPAYKFAHNILRQ